MALCESESTCPMKCKLFQKEIGSTFNEFTSLFLFVCLVIEVRSVIAAIVNTLAEFF